MRSSGLFKASITQTLLARAAPILQAIHDHPFNRKLANGTLSLQEEFFPFIAQDRIYLEALRININDMAGHAHHPSLQKKLLALSSYVRQYEQKMQAHMLKQACPDTHTKAIPNHACRDYIDHLSSTFLNPKEIIPIGLSKLGPCFFTYRMLGNEMNKTLKPDNLYTAWIKSYSSQNFDHWAEWIRYTIDHFGATAAPATREKMIGEGLRSFECELDFFSAICPPVSVHSSRAFMVK
jgi:thiaminase/transcriptional activator TenA